MLIKNDESCNSEKTILRYQENGIADLLASDWYGIMLLSPGGRGYIWIIIMIFMGSAMMFLWSL